MCSNTNALGVKIFKISFFVLLISFINFVFALEAPQNIVLEKATDNSLELSWDKVQWAWVYAISYWTVTASGWVYENELEVIVNDSATWTIENLDPDTKYYIAIKSYDSDNNESEYSNEVSFDTLTKLQDLKIDSINVNDTRNFDIIFNVNLNKDSNVNLNIVNLNDDLENIEVENYSIIWNTLKIFTNKELKINNKYSITVITLDWENWETIKAWVDWIFEFNIPEDTKVYSEENTLDLNSAWTWSEELINTTDIEENKTLGWKDLNNTWSITEEVAGSKQDLPTTWPTETLLFLLFSLIAGWLFINLRRKTNA